MCRIGHLLLFFFNDTATTEIYTLSLHDALPIWRSAHAGQHFDQGRVFGGWQIAGLHGNGPQLVVEHTGQAQVGIRGGNVQDRKSTRLNSSHSQISYAVFCLKKKKKKENFFNVMEHIE